MNSKEPATKENKIHHLNQWSIAVQSEARELYLLEEARKNEKMIKPGVEIEIRSRLFVFATFY